MNINENTKIQEIVEAPEFVPMRYAFIGTTGDWTNAIKKEMTPKDIMEKNPTWYMGDLVFGLQRLSEVAESGCEYVFNLYSEEEIQKKPALGRVNLVYHPAKQPRTDVSALLLSGGGYGAVCTMVESMPVAARLNELGITAFSLNYQTATEETAKEGLMPGPVEDVARAIMFIKKQFGISPETLIVGGFSAGGHLAGLWGASYANYQLPKPKMLLLDYPMLSLENFPVEIKAMFNAGLLGPNSTEENALKMAVDHLVTETYPKTYLVSAMDDMTVPAKDSQDLEEALVKYHIPHKIERVAHGGHGFGLGTATDAAGWVDRAIAFLEEDK